MCSGVTEYAVQLKTKEQLRMPMRRAYELHGKEDIQLIEESDRATKSIGDMIAYQVRWVRYCQCYP